MYPFLNIKIKNYEIGLLFREGDFQRLLAPGQHRLLNPLGKLSVSIASQREPWIVHDKLDMIVRSGALKDRAVVLDLKDYQRALVWIDGRFSHLLPPGQYAYWTGLRDVKTEIIDARTVRFEHPDLPVICRSAMADRVLESVTIEQGFQGVLLVDGDYSATLGPGRYAFWKNIAQTKVLPIDIRESILEIAGQEIMTADKVTLRMNALVTYRVTNVRQSVSTTSDAKQSLYREAQLALRAIVGARELDTLLVDKDTLVAELEEQVRRRSQSLGMEVISVGIRDVILPGEMKDLMNKVTEAKKAAEANLIVRREETAAMRSQANTAKLLESNPTLMRLRELEVLEKIASAGKLNIMLGEKGLTQQVMNLLG